MASKLCIVTTEDAPVPFPPKIQDIVVTSTKFVEDYAGPTRGVTVTVSLTWTTPVIDFGTLIKYEIYLTDGRVLSDREEATQSSRVTTVSNGLVSSCLISMSLDSLRSR